MRKDVKNLIREIDDLKYKIENFFAKTREAYVDDIHSNISGAIVEYGKSILAKKLHDLGNNVLDQYRKHWCDEYVRLIDDELIKCINSSTKAKFDRNKAYNFAIDQIKECLNNFITYSTNRIRNDLKVYNLSKLVHLELNDYDHFWELLRNRGDINLNDEYKFLGIDPEEWKR